MKGVLAGWVVVLEIFTNTKIYVKILGTTRMEKSSIGIKCIALFFFSFFNVFGVCH